MQFRVRGDDAQGMAARGRRYSWLEVMIVVVVLGCIALVAEPRYAF